MTMMMTKTEERSHVMKKSVLRLAAVFVCALAIAPRPAAAAETRVAAAGEGIYPPDTTFNSIPITGLQFGFGLEFSDVGDKVGHIMVVLRGISTLGQEQDVVIEVEVTGGSRMAANVAVISGTCTIDMGNGTPPLPGVPFSATVAANGTGEGAIGLVIGNTTLPNANVPAGSMTIQ
jgi:hypothetical protein